MDFTPEIEAALIEAAARSVIVEDFARLIHDLGCKCPAANREGALSALDMANWSVREAFQAWAESQDEEATRA